MTRQITSISSMATRQILADLAESYEQRTGRQVVIQSMGGVEAARRVRAGEPADIVVLASKVMEQLEAAVTDREKLLARMAQIDDDLGKTVAERDRQLVALDGEMGGLRTERAGLAPLIPADLLTLYDRIGANHGGVGAAELRRRRCTGCQLEINAADLRAFSAAAEDEVLRCEECGRILIRTPESGV